MLYEIFEIQIQISKLYTQNTSKILAFVHNFVLFRIFCVMIRGVITHAEPRMMSVLFNVRPI